MGSLLDLLPFLEGWDYHSYIVPYHAITKGAHQLKLTLGKPGWVWQFAICTTDAYGSIIIKVKGPGGTEHEMLVQPEYCRVTGFTQPDPSGYVSMYNRPLIASTAGFYVVSAFAGLTGSQFPIIGNATVESYLDTGSTQDAALLTAVALLIEIKDKRLFLESLAKFESPATILGMAAKAETSAPTLTAPVLTGDLGSQILEELKKIRGNLGKPGGT